jgi:pimeloyl-ACP methyl ester carboxylesterase
MRVFLIALAFLFTGCARLDDNMFNKDNSITAYRLDDYEGEVDFKLDETYKISDNLIYQFILDSKTADETEVTKINAIYIGDLNRIETDTVIMYCHGNKDHMDFYWQRAKLLANCGGKNRFGVLMIDYRGYGLSKGEPTEDGMYADVNAGLEWLKGRGLSNERLVMYGFSLGSAPACELTGNPTILTPSKLILEAPFASTEVMVQDASKLSLPASYFTNIKVDNGEEIKKVQQPFLWMHGKNDAFLSIETHGEIVFKNYKGVNGVAKRIENCDHGDVPEALGFTVYMDIITSFIKS